MKSNAILGWVGAVGINMCCLGPSPRSPWHLGDKKNLNAADTYGQKRSYQINKKISGCMVVHVIECFQHLSLDLGISVHVERAHRGLSPP